MYSTLSISALCLLPVIHAAQIPLMPQSHSEDYKFKPLNHLPGISPYFDSVGAGLKHKAPENCKVTAASYLVRHAAIYAQDEDFENYMQPFFEKLDGTYTTTLSGKKRQGWTGPLSFFENWQVPITEKDLENVTPQGLKDSKKVAKHLLSKYPDLVRTTRTIYADKKSRTQDTAHAFAAAFPNKVEVKKISLEHEFQSVTPHKFCKAFSKQPGNEELATYLAHYAEPIIARLQRYSPVPLTPNDIMGLQQTCGYESGIYGKQSELCGVFSDDEWMAYEYAWDMKYSYMVGHGNPLSPYLGFPWLNITAGIMSKFHDEVGHDPDADLDAQGKKEDAQRFFISFTHREVPPFIATALGLFNSSSSQAEEFPTDRINWSRAWRMADLIPFLGHIGVEKLTCGGYEVGESSNDSSNSKKKYDGTREFIRVIANTSPRPIPACQDGPGASCSVDGFLNLIKFGMEKYGDIEGVCKNEEEKVVEL